MKLPFKQKSRAGILIREFSSNVDSSELVWHRDREDRIVKICQGSGWKLQVENKLPVNLVPGKNYFIPKCTYHRVLRGNSDLVVEIYEPSSSSFEPEDFLLREYISLCRGK